jgi:hypothetical protein
MLPRKHGAALPDQPQQSGKAITMKTCTLFTAFAAAQTRTAAALPARLRSDTIVADDITLLIALRNSATDRDQIMQRRIGFIGGARGT